MAIITEPNLLIVEGKDEEFFFSAFIKHLGLQNIQILPIGGKTKLRENLKALILTYNFESVSSLGIIRDADSNPDSAFQSVKDALRSVKLNTPREPLKPYGNNPQIIIMILPEHNKKGMLEDVCLNSVINDWEMKCVNNYFQCLKKNKHQFRAKNKLSKAKINVYLASKRDPVKRLGEAAQAGYWLFNDNAFNQIKLFLTKLTS